MILRSSISAGELFELIRPAALVASALLSSWVFASARRHGISLPIALAWALASLVFPFIVVPIYLIARSRRKKSAPALLDSDGPAPARIRRRQGTLNLAYTVILLSLVGLYLYWDYQDIDSYLARAAQAQLRGDHARAIAEYRAALLKDDNAHTHKLLALELVAARLPREALSEFRLAEKAGEPDDRIPYHIGLMLEALNQSDQAALEYWKFLQTRACIQELPEPRCEDARRRVNNN